MSRRSLYLEGTFSESDRRNPRNGTVIRSRNPNPPAPVITPNDFDRYIGILRANNLYHDPIEYNIETNDNPYIIDDDTYFKKNSQIKFSGGTPNIYLFSLNMQNNDNKQAIDGNFVAGGSASIRLTQGRWTVIIVSIRDTYYEIRFTVYMVSSSKVIFIPEHSYYYTKIGSYDGNTPVLTFYETVNDPILSIASVSTDGNEIWNDANIQASRRSVNFAFH